jgi:hypothetical protein
MDPELDDAAFDDLAADDSDFDDLAAEPVATAAPAPGPRRVALPRVEPEMRITAGEDTPPAPSEAPAPRVRAMVLPGYDMSPGRTLKRDGHGEMQDVELLETDPSIPDGTQPMDADVKASMRSPRERALVERGERRTAEDLADPEGAPDGEHGFFGDLAEIASLNPTTGVAALRRMGRRGSRAVEEAVDDPVSLLTGAAQGLPFGEAWMDEVGGALAASGGGMADQSLYASMGQDPVSYEETRDAIRAEQARVHRESPHAEGLAEGASFIASLPLLGEVGAPVEGAGVLANGARMALMTGASGALDQAGREDDFADEGSLERVGTAGAVGTVLGAAPAVLGAGLRGGRRIGSSALTSLAEEITPELADSRRLASASGQSPVTVGAMRQWGRSPQEMADAAARVRRMGLVPGSGSTSAQVLARARAEVRRLLGGDPARAAAVDAPEVTEAAADAGLEAAEALAEMGQGGTIGQIADALQMSGQRIPFQSVDSVFAREQARLRSQATTSPLADRIAAFRRQLAETYSTEVQLADGQTTRVPRDISPDELRRELASMGRSTTWNDPAIGSVPELAASGRRAHRDLSALRDQWADEVLGDGTGQAYAEARRDARVAILSRDLNEDAMRRSSGSRAIPMTSYLAGGGLGTAATLAGTGHPLQAAMAAGGTVAAMAGNSAFRAREASMRASATERILATLQSGRLDRLGPYAELVQGWVDAGGSRLASRHMRLYQTDPQYRHVVDDLHPDEEDPMMGVLSGDTAMAVE